MSCNQANAQSSMNPSSQPYIGVCFSKDGLVPKPLRGCRRLGLGHTIGNGRSLQSPRSPVSMPKTLSMGADSIVTSARLSATLRKSKQISAQYTTFMLLSSGTSPAETEKGQEFELAWSESAFCNSEMRTRKLRSSSIGPYSTNTHLQAHHVLRPIYLDLKCRLTPGKIILKTLYHEPQGEHA